MDGFLTPFQENLILSLFQPGSRVTGAEYFQPEYAPSPKLVSVCLPGGEVRKVVLRMSRKPSGVERESRLLPVLSRLGLPVPTVLTGPASDPDDGDGGDGGCVSVLSLLPGETLQAWSQRRGAGLRMAGEMLVEAVDRLHQLTEPLSRAGIPEHLLPRRSLAAELEGVARDAGDWAGTEVFSGAVEKLTPVLNSIQTPLVFSNGDYQPGNFLSDGRGLTGFVDFESACFEDPHVGYAKYRIYDLHPLNKAGLVERYLRGRGLSETSFAPRLALRCLWTLTKEVPVSEGDSGYGRHVLRLLQSSLGALG